MLFQSPDDINIFRLPKPKNNLNNTSFILSQKKREEWKENEKGLVLKVILKIVLPVVHYTENSVFSLQNGALEQVKKRFSTLNEAEVPSEDVVGKYAVDKAP